MRKNHKVIVYSLILFLAAFFVAACAAAPAATSSGVGGGTALAEPDATATGPATGEAMPSVAPAPKEAEAAEAAKAAKALEESGGTAASGDKAKDEYLFSTDTEAARGYADGDSAAGADPSTGAPLPVKPGKTEGAVGGATKPKDAPTESGLKAGYSDDNEQFNYFVDFLDKFATVPHYELLIGERILVRVVDAEGRAVHNAKVAVYNGSKLLTSGVTYSDGTFYLFPLEYEKGGTAIKSYRLTVDGIARKADISVDRYGPRAIEVKLGGKRAIPAAIPMDVLFILDTTGSMGEEIERLRATIEIIYNNLAAVSPKPAIRFGMVLYKDRGDNYVTKRYAFTGNLDAFQASLDEVSAGGGGDYPEDLQAALQESIQSMDWNPAGIRMAFVVTDAPPQLYADEAYTYAVAAREAKAKGIKIYTVGTGGLGTDGEYILRQVSQYTSSRYIFLTYGEKTESDGGVTGSVSHHTGENFTTDKLEAIIIRFAKEELSWLSDVPMEKDDDYFTADKIPEETREATLNKLFSEAMQNLSDYSTLKLTKASRVAVLGIVSSGAAADLTDLKLQAEYFTERLNSAAFEALIFTLVDRANIDKVLREQELMLSGLVDDAAAVKVGKLAGAELLIVGTLYKKADRYELWLKLIRVETGEILSIAKAKVDVRLGGTK